MKLCTYALLAVSTLAVATIFAATPAPNCATSLDTLTVGTQFGVPPYESLTTTTPPVGTPTGFDIEIACELRKRLGFSTVRFRAVNPLDATVLSTGAATITISALNEITPTTLAREALVKYADFAYGFLFNGATVPGGVTPANVFTFLQDADRRVGVIRNSLEANILAVLGIEVKPFDTVADAVAELRSGTATSIIALFSNNVVVNTAASGVATVSTINNAVLPATPALDPFRSVGLGIAVSPSCCQLYVNIRQAIADMVRDGEYARIAARNGVPTTFSAGTDLTPAACASTTPSLPVRSPVALFLFNRFCACAPTITTTA